MRAGSMPVRNEIKSAADDLSKRTEQQAAAVEQTAAALGRSPRLSRISTRRAQEAGQLVSKAKSGAEESGDIVRRAVIAMEKIEQSSQSISNIIGVNRRDRLPDQPAGAQCRRRSRAPAGKPARALRSSRRKCVNSPSAPQRAAKGIKSLITTFQRTGAGRRAAGRTHRQGAGNDRCRGPEINRHVLAIVESAQEQSSGLQQINTAVKQMDQDTQKNAAMVEETNPLQATSAMSSWR